MLYSFLDQARSRAEGNHKEHDSHNDLNRVRVCNAFDFARSRAMLHTNSPRITVTACPPRLTRGSLNRTRTMPPRAEA